jgi:hypothetical protein
MESMDAQAKLVAAWPEGKDELEGRWTRGSGVACRSVGRGRSIATRKPYETSSAVTSAQATQTNSEGRRHTNASRNASTSQTAPYVPR